MLELQQRLAQRARGKMPSPIRALFKYLSVDGMISLGGGYPHPDTFAFHRISIEFSDGTSSEISGSELTAASQYGPSDVHSGLKSWLTKWHQAKDGVILDTSQIVALNGSQEGLFIMAYLFLEPGDSVLLSEPTYPGALSAFRSFTNHFIGIPLDENGLNTAIAERRLNELKKAGKKLPKFIYTIPNGHNPGGIALSSDRREHLACLGEKFDILILEDDPYQLIKLDDSDSFHSIQYFDKTGHVVRLDSFSKIFTPGLRVGYASGSAEMMQQFVYFKQAANLHTSMLTQALLVSYFDTSGIDEFRNRIRANCERYRTNRDQMVASARRYLPANVQFNIPSEGMFIWFRLPDVFDSHRMLDLKAIESRVLLVPGDAFSTQNGCKNCVRASFSMVTPEQIDEGMKRFGQMIRETESG
ncbi:PLP-dependent aminotransferase family protein [candidate division KSB1 bacterium]|nr:PLP-dependent aminotransferase family protein [candidate division KSB1 bacterium]